MKRGCMREVGDESCSPDFSRGVLSLRSFFCHPGLCHDGCACMAGRNVNKRSLFWGVFEGEIARGLPGFSSLVCISLSSSCAFAEPDLPFFTISLRWPQSFIRRLRNFISRQSVYPLFHTAEGDALIRGTKIILGIEFKFELCKA